MTTNRRNFLKTTIGAAFASLSGCAGAASGDNVHGEVPPPMTISCGEAFKDGVLAPVDAMPVVIAARDTPRGISSPSEFHEIFHGSLATLRERLCKEFSVERIDVQLDPGPDAKMPPVRELEIRRDSKIGPRLGNYGMESLSGYYAIVMDKPVKVLHDLPIPIFIMLGVSSARAEDRLYVAVRKVWFRVDGEPGQLYEASFTSVRGEIISFRQVEGGVVSWVDPALQSKAF